MAIRRGTAGNDTLYGTVRDDRLSGLAGNDFLYGRHGDDILRPGTGSDTLDGGFGDDIAVFTDASYTGPDTFDGGRGRDTVSLSGIPSVDFGLNYWDYDSQTGLYTVSQFGDPVDAPAGLTFKNVETLIGSRGDDLFVLVSSDDNLTINAGAGDDWIRAGSGNTVVHAGTGNDKIDFGYGRIAFYGDAGDDDISVGSATSGLARGGAGIDTISGYNSVNLEAGWALTGSGHRIDIAEFENISLNGAQDGAVARGDDHANSLDAGYWPSDFVFRGSGGDDHITGGDGADLLFGNTGDDVLDGAFGADTLTGGQGADVFRFADDFFSRAAETDTITDYHRGQGDRIDVSGIDADPSTFGDDPLRFIGAAQFDGATGELRYEARGGDTFLQIDRDGDASADFEIRLVGDFTLHRADFILSADTPT